MSNNDYKTVKFNTKSTKIIAHRGLSGIECENTISSFIAAGNRNYYGIETDVHLTADNQFVVIHDDDTSRVSNEKLYVEKSRFDDLRQLVLNDRDGTRRIDLHIPTLQEYIKICKRYEKKAILELKNRIDKDNIKRIIDIIKQENMCDETTFISFDYQNLVDIRSILSTAFIEFLYSGKITQKLIERLKMYNFNLDIKEKYLTKEAIILLHENGITINCWTCDDKHRAEQLADWNVDYITTNILQAN